MADGRVSTRWLRESHDASLSPMLDVPPHELRPILRVEYEELAASGRFEDERVELLYGAIVRMSPVKPIHDGVIQRLNHLLVRALYPRASVRIQSSFAASSLSEPQPDVAVVPPGDYLDAHPAEAWLIVEVSGSSLRKDQGVKARLYAESGVPEYWVVDTEANVVEVHADVVGGRYARTARRSKGDRVTLVRFPDVTIALSEVLP
jgi:Uma2 family endonuclease